MNFLCHGSQNIMNFHNRFLKKYISNQDTFNIFCQKHFYVFMKQTIFAAAAMGDVSVLVTRSPKPRPTGTAAAAKNCQKNQRTNERLSKNQQRKHGACITRRCNGRFRLWARLSFHSCHSSFICSHATLISSHTVDDDSASWKGKNIATNSK